jgi:hypothetical protein
MLTEPDRALLAEIVAMTKRLCEEVQGIRADIAEVRELHSPDAAPPSALRPPA